MNIQWIVKCCCIYCRAAELQISSPPSSAPALLLDAIGATLDNNSFFFCLKSKRQCDLTSWPLCKPRVHPTPAVPGYFISTRFFFFFFLLALAFLSYQVPWKDFRGHWRVEYWHYAPLGCEGKRRKQKGIMQASRSRGTLAQFDAAASNRHEQEKSIRPTRLLSKGLPPRERVERIKALGKKKQKKKKKVGEEEKEPEWQFVVFFVRWDASDLEITFILSVFMPGVLIIPDTFPSLL